MTALPGPRNFRWVAVGAWLQICSFIRAKFLLFLCVASLWCFVSPCEAQGTSPLDASYSSAADIPLTTDGFDGAGKTVNFALNFTPASGTRFTVVSNTGLGFIENEFDDLANGEVLAFEFDGVIYEYVAWYYGGDGNDLVLVPRYTGLSAWGLGEDGQLGVGNTVSQNRPSPVDQSGVLAGKTIVEVAAGSDHTLILCSDNTLVAFGENRFGELGIFGVLSGRAPVLVNQTGVLAGKTIVSISAGRFTSFALCSDGTIAAWGRNVFGNLGDGTSQDTNAPVLVDQSGVLAGKSVVSVAASSYRCFVLCSDGTVAVWGENFSGQLGDGTTTNRSLPVLLDQTGVLLGKEVRSIATGGSHSVALCQDGTLVSWGSNQYGQLGDGTTTTRISPVLVDRGGVLSGKTIVSPEAGINFSSVVCSDGTVASWGRNAFGQLGDGTLTSRSSPVLVDQSGALSGKSIVTLAAGGYHQIGLCSDGTFGSWGRNGDGQLGDGTDIDRVSPVEIDRTDAWPAESLTDLEAGDFHTLVVFTDPPELTLEEVGGDELSDGNDEIRFGSAALVGAFVERNFTIRNIGGSVLTDASVRFTGPGAASFEVLSDLDFALGEGESTNLRVVFRPTGVGVKTATLTLFSNDPDEGSFEIAVSGLVSSSRLSANFLDRTTVPLTTRGFRGGGNTVDLSLNYAPRLGERLMVVNNTSVEFIRGEFDNLPNNGEVDLQFDGIFYQYVAWYYGGDGNDLVLIPRNTGVSYWGGNLLSAQPSNGLPVLLDQSGVFAGKTVVAVEAGGPGGVALCTDGSIVSWGGSNESGQLGDGTTTRRSAPVLVDRSGVLAGKTVVAISAGGGFTLAVCSDGTAVAWGNNFDGGLGDGTTTNRPSPVLVDQTGVLAGKSIVAVEAADFHSMVLCSDGTLAAWGWNLKGQIGDGTTTSSLVPVLVDQTGVLAGKTVVAIAGGSFFSMALCSDGTVATWGDQFFGRLGDGTFVARSTPGLLDQSGVLAGKRVVSIASGTHHSAVLCEDGTVASWGLNSSGQLGDGTMTDRAVPTLVDTSGVLAGKTITQFSMGAFHSIATCSDGTVVTWGQNRNGQLGDGTVIDQAFPVLVDHTGVLSERSVSLTDGGSFFTLALLEATPEIVVEQPPGTELISGSSSLDFGTTALYGGSPIDLPLMIRNEGDGELTNLRPVFTGAQLSAFSVVGALPETIAPGESVDFTVRFVPTNAGANNATLNIQSNDRDENPFTISLAGTAVSEFQWSEVPGAEWYNIYIQKDGRLFQTFWREADEGTSWMPEVQLPAGNYRWWVRSWTRAGGSAAWIEQPEFRYANVELIAPEGSVSETRPVFEWTQSDHARQVGTTSGYYNLYIQRDGALWKNVWIEGETNTTWQQPEAEGPMPPGNYRFWVNPWNQSNGVGIWSDPMEAAIALPELIAPEGPLEEGNWTPEFSWTESESADYYQLYIQRNGALFKALWFEGSEVTTHRETEEMPVGEYKYWVNPWSFSGGFGPWIGPKEFSIGIPVPLTPTGVQEAGVTQPLFTWIGSAKHEWYQIYLQRNGSYFADPWLPSNGVVEESRDLGVADPDTIPPNLSLEFTPGSYRWWIRTYNAADGTGGWVEGPTFEIEQE